MENGYQQDSGEIDLGNLTWTDMGFLTGIKHGAGAEGVETHSRLVRIDDKALKGLTLDGVKALLKGPVGSIAKIEALTTSGQVLIVLVERRKPQAKVRPANEEFFLFKQAGDILDAYDSNDLPKDYSSAASSCEVRGQEPYATALTDIAVSVCNQWLDSNSMTAFVTLTEAARYYDCTGRYEQADVAIQQALTCVKLRLSTSGWERHIVIHFANYLMDTGRNQEAQVVWDTLLLPSTNTKNNPDQSLTILRPYANNLARQGRKDDAEKAYEKIVELSPQTNQWESLTDAGDFYLSICKFDKAAELFEKYAADASADIGDPEQNFYRRERKLRALLCLANAQTSGGHASKAINTLNRALSIYTHFADLEKQLQIERVPGFFPAMSEFEIKLASVYFDGGNNASAKTVLQSAIARIEKALGKDSPYLKKPLVLMASINEKMNDTGESIQNAKRAEKLSATPESPGNELRFLQYSLSRQAVTALKRKDLGSAANAVEQLLSIHKQAIGIGRVDKYIWNSLTFLCRLANDEQQHTFARDLTDKLLAAATEHGNDGFMIAPVLTERALFADRFELSEEDAWKKFEQSFPSAEQTTRKDSDTVLAVNTTVPELPICEKLRTWALAYSNSGDFIRADKLLQHAEKSKMNGRSLGFYADTALIKLHLGDFESAREQINVLLDGSSIAGANTARKLCLIAETYDKLGHFEEGRQILEKAIATEMYQTIDPYSGKLAPQALLQWKLSLLLARHNQPSIAYELLKKAMPGEQTKKPGGILISVAQLAEQLGLHEEAAKNYSSAQETMGQVIGIDPAARDLKIQLISKSSTLFLKSGNFPQTEKTKLNSALVNILGPIAGREKAIQLGIEIQEPPKAADQLTVQSLLNSARSFLVAGNLDEAVAEIQKALELYSQIPIIGQNTYLPLIYSPTRTKGEGICEQLCKAGRSADVERLLKDAISAAQSVYGNDSYEEAITLAEMAGFYAEQKNQKSLQVISDKILEIYSKRGAQPPAYSRSGTDESIRRYLEISVMLAQDGEPELGIEMDKKLLKLQRDKLVGYSDQISDTLVALGTIYATTGDYKEAESPYREAVEIKKDFWGPGRFLMYYMGLYADVLRKIGKSDKASELMTIPTEKTETSVVKEQNLEQLEESFQKARAAVPYGQKTVEALQKLAGCYAKERSDKLAEHAYLQLIEMADASSPWLSGKKHALLIALTKVYLQSGAWGKAKAAIERAKAADPQLAFGRPSVSDILKYAELEADAKENEVAAKDLDMAEQHLDDVENGDSRWITMHIRQMAKIWRKLGRTDKAEILETRIAGSQRGETKEDKSLRLSKDVTERLDERRKRLTETSQNKNPSSPSSPIPASNTTNLAFARYMLDIERRTKRIWFPPPNIADILIKVTFQINSSGSASNVKLTHASGNLEADNLAIKAIERASPYRPLPPGLKEIENFEFTFDIRTLSGDGDGAVRWLKQ